MNATSHPAEQFRAAIVAAGLTPPEDIHADGKLHRFPSNGQRGDDSGWYLLHLDGVPAGAFGCWREGLRQQWCSKTPDTMTQAEREAHRQKLEAMRQQRQSDTAERQQQAAAEAAQRWQDATPATSHPYLSAKGVQAHGVRQQGKALLIPMRDPAGTLHSLQNIDGEGSKRFLPGGLVKGCYHIIGTPERDLSVCEGYATAASIHEATGKAVAVAFTAGNLLPVAQTLRQQYPALRLIVAADDDWRTEGNPGMSKARQAAQAVAGLLAVPRFPADRPDKATDFNDLHQLAGLEAVQACIEAAQAVAGGATGHVDPQTGEIFPALSEPDEPTGSQWAEPVPLTTSIAPEAYPLEALPLTIREAVQEVLLFAQAPVAMLATSALSALSMAAQALFDVKRAEKLHGAIGIYTLIVADSGERKTTIDDFFQLAVRKWERDQEEKMRPQVERHKADMDAWKAEREGILAKIKDFGKNGKPTDAQRKALNDLQANQPEPPRVPRLIYSDVTPEELGYQLAKRWPSAAITSSEGGTVLGGHGMKGDSAMRNMARLNDLWSGQTIQSDRRTSDSWTARGARLTVGLQVQESTLRAFFDDSKGLARGTGFLARFLVAWPSSTQGTRLFKDAPNKWPKLAAFHERIERILNIPVAMDEDGALTPSVIPLSAQAKALWVEYHDEVETRLAVGGDYADVRDVASKSADNAARLAALFHIFEHGGGGAIGPDEMASGCMVAAWHLEESRRFFGELALPKEISDAVRVIQFAKEYCRCQHTGEVSTRTLQQLGPVRDKARLSAALLVLKEHHHIRLLTEGKRKLAQINPALLEAVAP